MGYKRKGLTFLRLAKDKLKDNMRKNTNKIYNFDFSFDSLFQLNVLEVLFSNFYTYIS